MNAEFGRKILARAVFAKNIAALPYQNGYLGAEMYSLGALIRKFAYFPSFLPFNVCYDHGLTLHKEILEEQQMENVH